jgi:hypothetical protein
MCNNIVEIYVPHGYDYKAVEYKCGNTDNRGQRTICEDCIKDFDIMADIKAQEENSAADNAWLKSAGWGEM